MVLLMPGVWGGTWWMPCRSGPQGFLLIPWNNLPRAFWHSSTPPSHGTVHLPSSQPWGRVLVQPRVQDGNAPFPR